MSDHLDGIQKNKTMYMMDQKIIKPFVRNVPINYEKYRT